MKIVRRILILARIAVSVFFPSRNKNGGSFETAVRYFKFPITVTADNIRTYLSNPNQAVREKGKLLLYIPDCPAIAAPLILFRLKRTGFSGCRACTTQDGLIIEAQR